MLPLIRPEEMAAIDARSPVAESVLIERAGAAVARRAVAILGGTYGRRVLVVAGKGNNGNDGRVAARRLARLGARVRVVEPGEVSTVRDVDLVIDAAFGTGFRGSYHAPESGPIALLAVDIVSGLDGITGQCHGSLAPATETVTFAALKPGIVLGAGREMSGIVTVADIGLDVGTPAAHLIEAADVTRWTVARARDVHKWKQAVWVIAGSPPMMGASVLSTLGALRGGATYVRVSSPGCAAIPTTPCEVVTHPLAMVGWQREITESADRFGALVVGPGLGRNESVASSVQELFRRVDRPMVIDADGLWALGTGVSGPPPAPRVLTPHDGEYLQLTGRPAGDERIEAARFLAAQRSATVLLKGPVTVVSDPDGRCGVISNGDQRLAVAGSGDVLSGLLGALLATGMAPFEASCSAAFLHAKAGSTLRSVGATASDIADAVSGAFDELAPKIVPVPAPRRMSR